MSLFCSDGSVSWGASHFLVLRVPSHPLLTFSTELFLTPCGTLFEGISVLRFLCQKHEVGTKWTRLCRKDAVQDRCLQNLASYRFHGKMNNSLLRWEQVQHIIRILSFEPGAKFLRDHVGWDDFRRASEQSIAAAVLTPRLAWPTSRPHEEKSNLVPSSSSSLPTASSSSFSSASMSSQPPVTDNAVPLPLPLPLPLSDESPVSKRVRLSPTDSAPTSSAPSLLPSPAPLAAASLSASQSSRLHDLDMDVVDSERKSPQAALNIHEVIVEAASVCDSDLSELLGKEIITESKVLKPRFFTNDQDMWEAFSDSAQPILAYGPELRAVDGASFDIHVPFHSPMTYDDAFRLAVPSSTTAFQNIRSNQSFTADSLYRAAKRPLKKRGAHLYDTRIPNGVDRLDWSACFLFNALDAATAPGLTDDMMDILHDGQPLLYRVQLTPSCTALHNAHSCLNCLRQSLPKKDQDQHQHQQEYSLSKVRTNSSSR